MHRPTNVPFWILLLTSIVAAPLSARAEDNLTAQQLAGRIDAHLESLWKTHGVQPAPPAGDAEFLRRVYLDLAGQIPRVTEVREFLEDSSPNKRQQLVKRLLDNPRFVNHFVNVWRDLMLPEADASFQKRLLVPGFEDWLRDQLVTDQGYDKLVRELLTAPIGGGGQLPTLYQGGGPTTPQGFFQAKDNAPENLAAATTRIFLGSRLECAQCHDHPFADWTQEQFWSMAAFFSGIRVVQQQGVVAPVGEDPHKRKIEIPGTEQTVEAAFLDGSTPQWPGDTPTREVLADWVTSKSNPYFAKATANRTWSYFFGSGLIDPVDEMFDGPDEASTSGLLGELADQLVQHDFDLKYLMQAITASRAYQLSSRRTHPSQKDPLLFARMPLRGLSGEQLYDSLVEATGYRAPAGRAPGFNGSSPRQEFLTKFATQSGNPIEHTTSILQALSMMNGSLTSDVTNLETSQTLAAIVDAPFLQTEQRLEALYLAALSRRPQDKELARMTAFVDQAATGDSAGDDREKYSQALADVFWALLNSAEFSLNH